MKRTLSIRPAVLPLLVLPTLIASGAVAQAASEAQPQMKPSSSVKRAPFINTWLVSGLFDNDAQNGGYNRDFIGEATARPQEGQAAASGRWKYFDDRLFSRNYDDYQDLFSYFKVRQGQSVAGKVVYAHVYIYSGIARAVQLRVGADNSFKAWVNGAAVAASTESSPMKGSGSTGLTNDPATVNNSGKDIVKASVQLNAGWNSLLLKVANQQDGRFGFYARLTDNNGGEIPGLTYSTGGGEGALAVATAASSEAKTGSMPVGYREWPYVGAHPDAEAIAATSNHQGVPLSMFALNDNLLLNSSDFVFNAQGSAAPYRWYVVAGQLPLGLSLSNDGTLHGTIAAAAPLGTYKFTVRVRDGKGQTANKELAIEVKERPNKWYEEARLGALIHAPEKTPPGELDAVALLMKRQGYGLGIPISYNNGDMLFRWPAPMAKNKTDDDWVARYKKALEGQGLVFGMYMGNLNNEGTPDFNVNQMVLVVQDAMVKYKPKALWFDWSGIDATSVDSLYSVIKSYDPECLVILNGHIRGSNGDWDVIDFEAWNAWGETTWNVWPAAIPWPKKHAPETWRLPIGGDFPMAKGIVTNWQEMLRVQISLIGEGYIANIDHTPSLSEGNLAKLSDSPLIQLHMKMADWASPAKTPPLYPSYTQVNPGPLREAAWGYNTINTKRDTVYLHLLKNPFGKNGLPSESSLTISPLKAKVKSITWLNRNKPLKFLQRGTSTDDTVTIELKGVSQDPVDTIIKIELAQPLPETTTVARSRIPAGNLASFKPAQLLSTDGTRTLQPSSNQAALFGVDGNLKSTAAGAWEYAWMYQVDLQNPSPISRVVLNFNPQGYATAYKVHLSDDGVDWKTIVDEKQSAGPRHEHKFAPITARYVRVEAVTPNGPDQPGGQMSIAELEVYVQ